ncbi:hypothetical protein [Winogradskyella aquimaris]|uniref:Lipoprotein n=1 Tax=Winogradskyella aquimaris TaxID=864074 RepID=A0ABU5EJB0_9FLAO|nr:hypothetical protein [Winogradskyella aquimaris]MDY2586435.1 hypothetical protein [Winogradskyella aquimaris]
MKKYAFLFLVSVAFLTSCSVENDDPVVRTEFMPIVNVAVPDHFVQGQTHEILMSYVKPNSCYVFNNIIFDIEGHERTVSILNTVYENENCTPQDELTTVSFDLTVSGDDVYLFKFYQGKDEYGVDQYHLVEVPVVNGRNIDLTNNIN